MLLSVNLAHFGRFFAKITDVVNDPVQKVEKETKKDSFMLDRRNGFCYDKPIKDCPLHILPIKSAEEKRNGWYSGFCL